jgi:hypothetical protein
MEKKKIKKIMDQKKLESSSKYNEYDLDGDGIVSDAELSNMKEIKETETALRKKPCSTKNGKVYFNSNGIVYSYDVYAVY